jgi:putative ABC transport system permease protein
MTLFDRDKWHEIISTIKKNKLRTFLTAFSIFWGMLMLIILLGSGKGLENGATSRFNDVSANTIQISSGQTSFAYKGYQPGRQIQLVNEDHDAIDLKIDKIENLTSRYYPGTLTVNYKNEYGSFNTMGIHPDNNYIEKTICLSGRLISEIDVEEKRKVVVIGNIVSDLLFKKDNPIGQYININKIPFKVVGVYTDDGDERQQRSIHMPISTSQKIFKGENKINRMLLTADAKDVDESILVEQQVRMLLADKHQFHPADPKAVFIWNNAKQFEDFMSLFGGIRIFIWIIGIMTIIAGVVGVSNIMYIIVKDRTREIGIRKALGANPRSIVNLILMESTVITFISGYFGLFLGILILEFIGSRIPSTEMFANPEVNLKVAFGAMFVLVIAGLFAGFIPARKAAAIKPIEALREE